MGHRILGGGVLQFGAEREVNREEEAGKRQNHQGSLIKLQRYILLYISQIMCYTHTCRKSLINKIKKYKKKVLAKQAWGLEFQS